MRNDEIRKGRIAGMNQRRQRDMILWDFMPFSFLRHLKWKTCTITALEHGRSFNSECMNNLVTFVFNFVFRSESSYHFCLNFVIFVLDMLGISIIPSVIPASRGSALPIPCWMTDVVARAVAPNGFLWAVVATIETKSMATQKPEFLGKADLSHLDKNEQFTCNESAVMFYSLFCCCPSSDTYRQSIHIL